MIKPVNGHLLIEPVKHESFMSTQKEVYEEVGVVVETPLVHGSETAIFGDVKRGDKVFFDSYLAAKYPKNEEEYFWLVKWEDVRAIEHAEEVSK